MFRPTCKNQTERENGSVIVKQKIGLIFVAVIYL